MNYPNKIKKEYYKQINYGNRGMDLKNLINITNEYLLENDIAVIYKKPTPIGVVKVSYELGKQVITRGYFASPSTLDYNGVYKGKYIEFDAKTTEKKTSFPLANIHSHQIEHIKKVINHKGIAFLIIEMNNLYYLLDGAILLEFIKDNTRKSIPYEFIKNNAYELEYNYTKGLNYIKYVDIIGGYENEENEIKKKI